MNLKIQSFVTGWGAIAWLALVIFLHLLVTPGSMSRLHNLPGVATLYQDYVKPVITKPYIF